MTKLIRPVLIRLAALGAALIFLPDAHAHDLQFNCESSSHAFIASLLDDKYIEPDPMRVEANSVNVFRPAHGAGLTAFGLHVYAVFGYAQDDAMFRHGSGQPLASPVYGVVVSGASETVEARVHAAGSDAAMHTVIPLTLTAIVCKGH